MGKIGKTMMLSALVLGIVFFALGFGSADRAGISMEQMMERVMANIREMNIAPALNEYSDVFEQDRIPLDDSVTKIVIHSSFPDFNITSGGAGAVDVLIEGSIHSAFADELYAWSTADGCLTLDIAKIYSRTPSATGLHVSIDLPAEFTGEIEINTVSGNVYLEAAAGQIGVKTTSGDIAIRSEGKSVIKAGSVSGNLEINGESIRFDASSLSGNANISGEQLEGTASTVSGSITLTGNQLTGDSKLNSVSGSVEANLLGSYDFTADSTSGNIQTSGGDGANSGRMGEGGSRLDIQTTSGDISLQQP